MQQYQRRPNIVISGIAADVSGEMVEKKVALKANPEKFHLILSKNDPDISIDIGSAEKLHRVVNQRSEVTWRNINSIALWNRFAT